MKLSKYQRIWIYSTFSVLFVTGSIWFILHTLEMRHNDSAPWLSTREITMLKIHGGAAMIFLVLLGTLIPIHIRRGLGKKENVPSGFGVIGAMLLLAVTGYGLYYFGDEHARSLTSSVHTFLGLASPFVLAWHVANFKNKA